MFINFDTENKYRPEELRGLIAFLTLLLPVNAENNIAPQAPAVPITLQTAIESTTDAEQRPEVPTPEQPTPEPATRKRRTRAEMAAEQAQPTDPTQGSAVTNAAASATTQPAPVTAITASVSAKSIDADTLRALLNAHIAAHSMEAAITILQSFGCNRVTEALALDPAKLNELAGKLQS